MNSWNFSKAIRKLHFVSLIDGSTDKTGRMLESLREKFPERILVITVPANKGKAAAVQAGMISALQHFTCGYFGFFDADLATRLDESFRLRSSLQEKPSLELRSGHGLPFLA